MGRKMKTATICKWGNSAGIRIEKSILESVSAKIGDTFDIISQDGDKIILKKVFRHKTLKERIEEFDNKPGEVLDYDWGEPVGKEML